MAETALIVIDLQTGMFDGVLEPPLFDHEALVGRVRALIAAARAAGAPVGFVRHDGGEGDSLAPGEPGWPVYPGLGQRDDEPTFGKSVGDAFSRPEIGAWLESEGVRRLVLAGAQSDQCVAATVGGALREGYAVSVASDAHSTWDFGGETAAQIIARKNQEYVAAGAKVVTVAELATQLGKP